MAETILETFLQISDLHIGDFDAAGSAVVHARWASCRAFEGLLGHHYQGLRALHNFYQQLRHTEDAKLVVVGDLTSCGSLSQFRDAAQYLTGQLNTGGVRLGLRAPNWATAAVPGNHDHWPGQNFSLGSATAGLGETFPQVPTVKTLSRLSSGHFVTFLQVDTDADVSPIGALRLLAIGDFQNELARLDGVLQDPLPHEVRVLVLHHSRCHGATTLKFPRKLRIRKRSWDALSQFITKHRIQILMTGHIHVDHLQPDALPDADGNPHSFLECRSGPAAVRDDIPSNWRTLKGLFPNWRPRPNGVIVHRIVEKDDGAIVWRAEVFRKVPGGFEPLKPNPMVEELPL